jgi:predicted DNA-binding transcriptional regulator AlpA
MEQLFNQRQAAHLLRLSVRTLERHRVAGTGPRFVRLGRLVRYRAVDLADWVDGGLPPPIGQGVLTGRGVFLGTLRICKSKNPSVSRK